MPNWWNQRVTPWNDYEVRVANLTYGLGEEKVWRAEKRSELMRLNKQTSGRFANPRAIQRMSYTQTETN